MIALHAVWSHDSTLCLWGEDAGLPLRAPRRRGRPPSTPRARPHPFAAAPPDLVDACKGLGLAAPAAAERRLRLMLPSSKDGPAASPQLLVPRLAEPEGLDAWEVQALTITPGAAVDVLLGLPPDTVPGVAVGDSLRFLAEAAKLGLELVARGRLLPGLARSGDVWTARWRPVTDDPGDEERVRLLVRAVPPLVRAEYTDSPEGHPAAAVVGDLLAAVVDACARTFLAGGESRPAAGVARGTQRRGPCGARRRARSRRALRGARPLARERAPGRGPPLVPDVLPAVRARGGWSAPLAGRDPRPGQGRSARARAGPGRVVRQRQRARRARPQAGEPQERLLGGLGHALRVWPGLGRRCARPRRPAWT